MKVPLLDLTKQFSTIESEVRSAIDPVIRSQQFILGPDVRRLEEEIAAYCGVRHAVGVSSGTDALLCALMSLGIGPGDEVILPPFTFFATAGCVSRVGARPVFVDIEPKTFNIDPAGIEAALTERTKAVMPVHLFGQCADMDPIREIAGMRGIRIIEDAAQAIGASYRGRKAGSLGDVGCFSFFPTKNLGGFGDGGMIVTDDGELAERMAAYRMHGNDAEYHHRFVGGNFRLDSLQAAVLRVKLRHVDEWHEARRRNAARYDELLAGSAVTTPEIETHNRSVYNQYVIRCPDRDGLRRHLTECGVGTAVYYPLSLHRQRCFADLGHRDGDFPESERAEREVLALPIYPELSDEQLVHVATSIKSYPSA